MLSPDDCDDCTPSYLQRRWDTVPPSTIILSSLPFVVTWLVTVLVAQHRLLPVLSNDGSQRSALPYYKDALRRPSLNLREHISRPSAQRLASLVFSASIGLSAVLTELLLCEISNTLNPAARALALRLTLSSLMILNILVTPALEIHGFAKTLLAPNTDTISTTRSRPRLRFCVEGVIFAIWLIMFWYLPRASILRTTLRPDDQAGDTEGHRAFTEACLERMGIIGISLMASLAGFAAVSSLWQNFGVRHKSIRESDVQRKEAGLLATEDMLSVKRSRLRALERKMSDQDAQGDKPGYLGRMIGSFRGSAPEVQELKSLQMEISGLQTMQYTLSSSLSAMRARYTEQKRAYTNAGRILRVVNTIFALYCAYRIGATSFSTLRRWRQPTHSFATSDPINNILAVLTTHWDSNLDRAAWSRQISFLLSGVMLLASFSAVLQTFRLFSRFAPGLMQQAQTSLPLIISQVAGTYVISSALLLRSNLPEEFGGVISEALGAPLEGRFVERWFESWFLIAVCLTAVGILLGKKFGTADEWEEDYDEMELGKRS